MKGNFWEVFGMKDCEEVPESVKETALQGKEFTISNLTVRDSVTVDSAASAGPAGRLFNMGFRWAPSPRTGPAAAPPSARLDHHPMAPMMRQLPNVGRVPQLSW